MKKTTFLLLLSENDYICMVLIRNCSNFIRELMRSTFYLFAMLFLATTFFSCETVEPSPRPTWGGIVNPIEAFMYPRDLKVFADGEEGRRWLILVVPDSTKSSFAPTSKSTPAEVARYKELSQLVGNPTEPVVNECHFHRTWLTQGVKAIRVVRTQADGRDEEVTAQCGNLYFYTDKQIFDCQFKCGDRSIFAKPLGETVEADYLWLPGRDVFGLVAPLNPDHLKLRIVLRLADGTEIEKELSEKGKK